MDRKDIDVKYKWDLESIYNNMDDFEEDIKRAKELTSDIVKYKGKVIQSAKNLLEVSNLEIEQGRILNKLYLFANLHYNLDTRSTKWSNLVARLIDIFSGISTKLNFISVELGKLSTETLTNYVKELPELKKYEFSLRHIIKNQEHILSEKEEEILSKLDPVLDGGSDIFSKLDDADVEFGDVEDKSGEKHKLTNGTYREFMGSSDRVLRRNAFFSMHEYYEKHKNTIGECLANHIKTMTTLANIRGYKSSIVSSLSADDVTEEFYLKFIDNVHNHLPVLHRMMEIYKKALKVDEMHIYDINARIGKFNRNLSIEEIESTVKSSLQIMGKDYISIVDEAFSSNWVDFYETKGKRSGAFSSGSFDTKPYILLNYTGSFDDMETLAHELGHSIHSFYSNKNQGPENCDYPIFLAEIASTTHEVLLNHYLLQKAKNKDEKIYILNNILSNYKSTVFRQTEFAEFEMNAHKKIENGENLSWKEITDIYFDLQNQYYGPNVVEDELIKYEVLRIPHFYTSFYVYKYAVGLACAYKFAGDIIGQKEGSVENYIKFISSGGKDYPINILKECGIDLENYDVLGESVELINSYLDELETLVGKE